MSDHNALVTATKDSTFTSHQRRRFFTSPPLVDLIEPSDRHPSIHPHPSQTTTMSSPLPKSLAQLLRDSTLSEDERVRHYSCDICLGAYRNVLDDENIAPASDKPVRLPCGHIFGSACIASWVNDGNNSCPTCRSKILDQADVLDRSQDRDFNVMGRLFLEDMAQLQIENWTAQMIEGSRGATTVGAAGDTFRSRVWESLRNWALRHEVGLRHWVNDTLIALGIWFLGWCALSLLSRYCGWSLRFGEYYV